MGAGISWPAGPMGGGQVVSIWLTGRGRSCWRRKDKLTSGDLSEVEWKSTPLWAVTLGKAEATPGSNCLRGCRDLLSCLPCHRGNQRNRRTIAPSTERTQSHWCIIQRQTSLVEAIRFSPQLILNMKITNPFYFTSPHHRGLLSRVRQWL